MTTWLITGTVAGWTVIMWPGSWAGPDQSSSGKWTGSKPSESNVVRCWSEVKFLRLSSYLVWFGSGSQGGPMWSGSELVQFLALVLVWSRSVQVNVSLRVAGRRRMETNLSGPVHPLCNHATNRCPPDPGPPAPVPQRSSAHRGGRPGSRTAPPPDGS